MRARPNTIVTQRLRAVENMMLNKVKLNSKRALNNQDDQFNFETVREKLLEKIYNNKNITEKSPNQSQEKVSERLQVPGEILSYSDNSQIGKETLELLRQSTKDIQLTLDTDKKFSILETKAALSPYDAIMATPMRVCTVTRKAYPSALLARFSIGIHPKTNKQWGYPSMNESDGRGYYVKLNKHVIDALPKKEYKRLFRGAAEFPKTGMSDHIQELLIQKVIQRLEKIPSLVPLKLKRTPNQDTVTLYHSTWQYFHNTIPNFDNEYHCLFVLNHYFPPNKICSLSHTITINNDDKEDKETSIPTMCIDVRQPPWQFLLSLLKKNLPADTYNFMAVAIPKTKESVPLMIDLYRLKQFLSNEAGEAIEKNKKIKK